jgi:hypothetical protein
VEETLSDRIANVLRKYTQEQAFLELFANAVDAGATRFSVLLDHAEAPASRLILDTLHTFQKQPSLIFWNDAQFQDKDFVGIRKVGRGSKQGSSEKIGRFGLGALSMYHFTEVGHPCPWICDYGS